MAVSTRVWNALQHASEQICSRAYRAQLAANKGKPLKRFIPPATAQEICAILGDHNATDEDALAFLHTYDVENDRFGNSAA